MSERLWRRSQRRIVVAARADDRTTFRELLREHLGMDQPSLDVVLESWPTYDHVNVQAGLDAWLDEPHRGRRLVGVVNFRRRDFGLSELMRSDGAAESHSPSPGNVSRVNLASGPSGEVRPCVACAVYLVTDGERRAALLFKMGSPEMGRAVTTLEIASEDPAFGARIAAEVRLLALENNVYRRQVVSFGHDMFGDRDTVLSFHSRPSMTSADLILPEETITTITRQVVGVARHRGRLLAAHQHLKRGPLLYGPPGALLRSASDWPRDWCHDIFVDSCVRWFPVPSGGDLGGGSLVPAVRAVLPRRRGAARRAWSGRRSRHHLPVGPTLHAGVRRGGTDMPARAW